MDEMNKLREKFNSIGEKFDGGDRTIEEVWSLVFGRQALMFDAIIILFNEIVVSNAVDKEA